MFQFVPCPRRQTQQGGYEVFHGSICQNGCVLKETLSTGRPLRDVRIDVLNSSMEPVPLLVSTAVLRTEHGLTWSCV
jgi:hypothetical protein